MRTTIIASFVALAVAAPLILPTVPIVSTIPKVPEVGLKSPVALPGGLPVKRGGLGLPGLPALPKIGLQPLPPIALSSLPIKRDPLGLPVNVDLPGPVKTLLDGGKGLPQLPAVPGLPQLPAAPGLAVKRGSLGAPIASSGGPLDTVTNLLHSAPGLPALPPLPVLPVKN
ncbi:hypothetical protein EJ02DRAFT_459957 [Clathrospora elynae]|uniref:Uncharacterized protein n=1 Tax=Clathrospora elynae TaxID=706981 RepID=A0A6A5S7M6_9PLEO|nr:hypothetical protein EJ02DRAFT_459957 [Clathrospora elynae]